MISVGLIIAIASATQDITVDALRIEQINENEGKSMAAGAATSISNVGPGLGPIIGPNGDFSSLPDISKWILSVGMILGRLELFAILVLFLPSFWRN